MQWRYGGNVGPIWRHQRSGTSASQDIRSVLRDARRGSGPLFARPGSYQTFIPRRRMSAMTASMPFLSMVLIPLVLKVRVT